MFRNQLRHRVTDLIEGVRFKLINMGGHGRGVHRWPVTNRHRGLCVTDAVADDGTILDGESWCGPHDVETGWRRATANDNIARRPARLVDGSPAEDGVAGRADSV